MWELSSAVRLAKHVVGNIGQTGSLRAENTGCEGARLELARQELVARVAIHLLLSKAFCLLNFKVVPVSFRP